MFRLHLVRQLTADQASVWPLLSLTPKDHNSNNQETDQRGYQDRLCDESQTFNANDAMLHGLRINNVQLSIFYISWKIGNRECVSLNTPCVSIPEQSGSFPCLHAPVPGAHAVRGNKPISYPNPIKCPLVQNRPILKKFSWASKCCQLFLSCRNVGCDFLNKSACNRPHVQL